ncbi:GNAT family N-acetyltransferase [Chitinolyticbacter albus]|uniref:GNAT family N-acetyltransferase n=1 Tax=Chitinolyticbacter albus TaxID=2961951 RepID=UPI00210DB17C|nr:N-acetyltransferase [Chitinolyticbacter albus]
MLIRHATPIDAPQIHAVTSAAFGRVEEADLIEALVDCGHVSLSLVACDLAGEVCGHVLFSAVDAPGVQGAVLGLAPIAVAPEAQGRGLGSALIQAALRELKVGGIAALVVLGNPAYYRRFGFVPASQYGLTCAYDVPAEYFLALELAPGALAGGNGVVQYAPEFSSL